MNFDSKTPRMELRHSFARFAQDVSVLCFDFIKIKKSKSCGHRHKHRTSSISFLLLRVCRIWPSLWTQAQLPLASLLAYPAFSSAHRALSLSPCRPFFLCPCPLFVSAVPLFPKASAKFFPALRGVYRAHSVSARTSAPPPRQTSPLPAFR